MTVWLITTSLIEYHQCNRNRRSGASIPSDVIAILWSETDARTVIEPEPTTLWLFLGSLQALASPDPEDALMMHAPAVSPEQGGDATIAVAAELFGKRDDGACQRILVIAFLRSPPLR